MEKYLITMLCNDTDGETYTDYVNMLFDNREIAEKEMRRCIKQEVECLKEGNEDSDIQYYAEDNAVYADRFMLTEYNVIKITQEYKEESETEKSKCYSEQYPDVTPELYNCALGYFRHFFEIDEKETMYACGSLEKLSIIIGKDYRNSDLIYEIADNSIGNCDLRYILSIDAWENAIKRTIGEDKYDMAFEEWHPDIPEIMYVIRLYQKDFGFSNRDVECIKENKEVMATIFFAIVEYLDKEDICWEDISFADYASNWKFDVLDIIKKHTENFKGE